jgi:hypothetical protein
MFNVVDEIPGWSVFIVLTTKEQDGAALNTCAVMGA